MEPLLVAAGVGKSYDGVRVLDDVSFTVTGGSIHGLLGPNGAGKTTLLRILLGLVRADAGAVTLLGSPATAGLAGVAGFVESPAFWPYLTARRTLELLADLEGHTVDVPALLEQVGLAAKGKVGSFSVGMRQRLGIAAALLRSPRLLLLDEPSTGLDVAGVRDLHAILRDLVASGCSVVLSSHVMAEVDALCTDATVMSAGRVVTSGSLDDLRARAPDPRVRVVTSDDARAAAMGLSEVDGDLFFQGPVAALDELVFRLAGAGIAVRELVRVGSPLGELFLTLTS